MYQEALMMPGSWDCVVSIAARYGPDGPETKSQWGKIFSACPNLT